MIGGVIVLAGGHRGAKLARGMLDVVGPERLVVIANTGDDVEIHGGYVSPDVDLVSFWLADRIDARGWGLAGDTFNVMEGLRELGDQVWFSLGDRDLAIALWRARALDRGRRATEVQLALLQALGVHARVLPMSDQPVRTRVMAGDRWWPFQEFMITAHRSGGWDQIQGVEFRGAANARATPEVLEAIAQASVIVIGPSNPIISIGPILAVEEIRAALAERHAPAVARQPVRRWNRAEGTDRTVHALARAAAVEHGARGVLRGSDRRHRRRRDDRRDRGRAERCDDGRRRGKAPAGAGGARLRSAPTADGVATG